MEQLPIQMLNMLFTNAPLPLEKQGGSIIQRCFGTAPGASKWAGSLGGELTDKAKFFGNTGKIFHGVDSYARSRILQVHLLQNI
jgi:iron complex outermembrane receptor protein